MLTHSEYGFYDCAIVCAVCSVEQEFDREVSDCRKWKQVPVSLSFTERIFLFFFFRLITFDMYTDINDAQDCSSINSVKCHFQYLCVCLFSHNIIILIIGNRTDIVLLRKYRI